MILLVAPATATTSATSSFAAIATVTTTTAGCKAAYSWNMTGIASLKAETATVLVFLRRTGQIFSRYQETFGIYNPSQQILNPQTPNPMIKNPSHSYSFGLTHYCSFQIRNRCFIPLGQLQEKPKIPIPQTPKSNPPT